MPDTWIQTRSGARVDVLNPDPEEIHLDDLLYGISTEMRFANQLTRLHWSVMHHTLGMYYAARVRKEPGVARQQILFHDLKEAYLRDLATPHKKAVPLLRGPDFTIERAIFKRFEVPYPIGSICHELDQKIARWEAEEGFETIRDNWTDGLPAPEPHERAVFEGCKQLQTVPVPRLVSLWKECWQDAKDCID